MGASKGLWSKMQHAGIHVSDWVASAVGTWRFVFVYTGSMFLWIWLHKSNYLDIDSKDFIKFNLWLSYFAGTQASIVLMSTTRQAHLDREKHEIAFEIDHESLLLAKEHKAKIANLVQQVSELELVIEELLEEKSRSVQ